jgi:peptidoglycan/xylan/chitin deacetylase (PgdA/CDA1 family)
VTPDDARSARLLLHDAPEAAAAPPRSVARAVRGRGVPPLPVRYAQALALRRGPISWERSVAGPFTRAREEALGGAARGAPRVLVRVDEFPHAGAWDPAGRRGVAAYERFHEAMGEHGVPYLVAVCARVARDYLDPDAAESRPLDDRELAMLRRLAHDGVEFAVHGYDHRTRRREPRQRSELAGLSPVALEELLERSVGELRQAGVEARAFVPPFNRFDAAHWSVLARRFEVVCGGPETVPLLGFHRTPLWRGDAVYMPSYRPLYGRAGEVAAGIERLLAREAAIWAPVTLHWGWEEDDGRRDLDRLARVLSRCATPWADFLAAARASASELPA